VREVEARDERGVPMQEQEPASSKPDTIAVETGEETVLGGGYKIQYVRHRVCHRRLEAGDGRHGNARLLAFSFWPPWLWACLDARGPALR